MVGLIKNFAFLLFAAVSLAHVTPAVDHVQVALAGQVAVVVSSTPSACSRPRWILEVPHHPQHTTGRLAGITGPRASVQQLMQQSQQRPPQDQGPGTMHKVS